MVPRLVFGGITRGRVGASSPFSSVPGVGPSTALPTLSEETAGSGRGRCSGRARLPGGAFVGVYSIHRPGGQHWVPRLPLVTPGLTSSQTRPVSLSSWNLGGSQDWAAVPWSQQIGSHCCMSSEWLAWAGWGPRESPGTSSLSDLVADLFPISPPGPSCQL